MRFASGGAVDCLPSPSAGCARFTPIYEVNVSNCYNQWCLESFALNSKVDWRKD